jgi:hypothetical protein
LRAIWMACHWTLSGDAEVIQESPAVLTAQKRQTELTVEIRWDETMNGFMRTSSEPGRTAKLLLFQLLVLFWLIKLAYAVKGYFSSGIAGVRSAILHGGPISTDPKVWGHPNGGGWPCATE